MIKRRTCALSLVQLLKAPKDQQMAWTLAFEMHTYVHTVSHQATCKIPAPRRGRTIVAQDQVAVAVRTSPSYPDPPLAFTS